MASGMFQQLMIPTFSGKNYDNWAFRMKLAFDSYELTDIVMNGYTEPQDESILSADEKKKLDENRQKSKRALQIIGQALDDSVVGRIKPATTAKQAWDILETAYQGTSKVKIAKLQALRREFENLQMKDSDSIDQFTYRVTELVNQIRQNGDELVDQKVVEKVLRSLPRKFDAIVVVIEESKDLTKYSIDELVGSLKNYEDRLNRNDNTSLEHAFKTQMTFGRGRGRGNPSFRGRGRGRSNFQREERKYQDPGGRRNQNFNSRESNYNQASQSYWSEKGIGSGRESVVTDLNSSALGFRTLRLHGYPVSSDVFKDQNGQFACSANTQTEGEMRGVLNLFRASLVAFPGEKVMEDAEIFSTTYLKEALKTVPICSGSLSGEIENVLEYGWLTNFPRLEARNYIDIFGKDTSPCLQTEKLLELAKLEFNIFHSLQQRELKQVSRWWKDSGFSQLTFTRHRHVEFYTLASCIAIEPKHSAFRLGFAKLCYLGIVLDDIYDTFGTMDELELFTAAIKRWDPSATKCLPEYMKGVYMVFYECVNQMAREAEKTQGRDTLSYARNTWEAVFDAFLEEAKWISSGYIPTFEEYLENGKVSFGYRAATLQPILTLDVPLPLHILQEIDFPSRFNDLAASILRLRGDVCGYKAERSRGEEASSISCYMKDNPGAIEEDALNQIDTMIKVKIKELNWEFLKPDSNVPISSKKHAFDILRAFYHLYKYRDGFSIANNETKSLVMRTLLETVSF